MKYVDFVYQSLIFLLVLVGFLITMIEDGNPAGGGLAALYAAILLGPWQVVSSLLSVVFRSPLHKRKRLHLLGSVGYFVMAAIVLASDLAAFADWLAVGLLYIPPVVLAIYYYILTWRWTFRSSGEGKFLPHINY